MNDRLKLLFLCTGNSCRSQMAEGWTRHLKGEVVDAYSAGIETHGLNPHAVKAMAEAGVDITSQRSENIKDFADQKLDVVVTVCGHAHETCPIFPGKVERIHWNIDDPFKRWVSDSHDLVNFRKTREDLSRRINDLLSIRFV